ncbi:hypothetical protein ABW19_dt0200547 [Dactylella cylindrospora]|nr:hypothetical protein ABW19_dt0200547 [Dactylella cylindrospora]
MANIKSANQSRYQKGYPPPPEQKFHSRESSLGEHDHVTAAIGDLYGGSDDEIYDDGEDYNQSQGWQSQHQQSQHPLRYQHTQNLPVTPPQTPTKGRKSPGSSSISPRSPNMDNSPTSPSAGSPTLRVPPNSPHLGGDGASKAFPLNNLDYESNPEAVQQELENLQALRRMSMDVSNVANDPDLPAFNFVPPVAPKGRNSDDDAASLFWVPARLHPELAPKAFKSFVESRVEQIREHSEGGLSPDGLQAGPSLRRKKSMLSRQIDTDGKAGDGYEDGADKLRRRNRSSSDGEPTLSVSELGEVLSQKDPADLMRQLSISKTERALSGEPTETEDDQPIFAAPPPGQALRRSTRTALRRGSIRKGERVAPSSRRAKLAAAEDGKGPDEPEFKLSRVRTEPIPSISISSEEEQSGWQGSRHQEKSATVEEPGRQITTPPGFSARPTSPPKLSLAEKMARSKSDPESPPQQPYPLPQQPIKIERKELHPQRQSSKDQKAPPPNGQSQAKSPSPPPAPTPPPTTASSEPPASKSKRPPLKRGSPGTSSYEPTKDTAPSAPVPPPAPQIEVKRKEVPGSVAQHAQHKEVGRKSSWAWLTLGGDGDKDKEKDKEKDKDSAGKKVRKVKSTERDREKEEEKERKREHKREKEREKEREKSSDREHARLDLLQKSIDGPKKRESLDGNVGRPSVESLEREREKEKEKAARKAAGSDKDKDKKESGIFMSIFGGSKKKQEEGKSKAKSQSNLAVPQGHPSKSPPVQTYYYTRFPIHIERAIYRLSHLKLANPRRPLLQQVLLSNFMYAYLAKVQQMQPNGSPAAVQSGQSQQLQQPQQQQQQYQQHHHGGAAAVNGDETQPLESDDEDYDFDDDGRDDRPYDNQQTYGSRTTSREGSSNGPGYRQDYDGSSSYGYHSQDQYQQDDQGYYQQSSRDGSSNGQGNGGYSEKDYDYYQNQNAGYDRRSEPAQGYEHGTGNRYHHQRSGSMHDDRDYSDDMW